MKILISPYSRSLRNGNNNPKNYPFWQDVINALVDAGHHVTQCGIGDEKLFENISDTFFDKSLEELKHKVEECDTWLSVDNFFQHFCHLYKKRGIVIFSQSNPKIFGHAENINILKDVVYLREKQFDIWECATYTEDAYVDPTVVVDAVLNWRK